MISSKITAAVSILFVGCVGSKVAWVERNIEAKEVAAGSYRLIGVGSCAQLFEQDGSFQKIEEELSGKGTVSGALKVPVRVEVDRATPKDSMGAGSYLNNVFSICTLGMWPWVVSKEQAIELKVSSPTASNRGNLLLGERQWSSVILPIGALPCPGWGDWRGCESSKGDDEFRAECEKKAISGLLTQKFYENASRDYAAFLSNVSSSIENLPAEKDPGDRRPIFLLDSNDIHVRCKGEAVEVDVDGIGDMMEDCLKGTDLCRVLSKKSIARSMKEKALFSTLSGEKDGMSDITVPAYRVETTVEQYSYDEKTATGNKSKKHTFHKTSHTKIEGKHVRAVVQMVIKVFDLKSGHLVLSENLSALSSDASINWQKDSRKGHQEMQGKHLMTREYYLNDAVAKIMKNFSVKIKDMQKFHVVDCTKEGYIAIDATDRILRLRA